MQHIRKTIEELRRYIAVSEVRADLEEIDTLLAIALEEIRRKLAEDSRRRGLREGPQTSDRTGDRK